MYTLLRVHSAYTVWKCTIIFSRILNTGPHSCILVNCSEWMWVINHVIWRVSNCSVVRSLRCATKGFANCTLLMENRAVSSRAETPMSAALRMHHLDRILSLVQRYDATPSESFGDDIAVELLKHAQAEHVRAITKLTDGDFTVCILAAPVSGGK